MGISNTSNTASFPFFFSKFVVGEARGKGKSAGFKFDPGPNLGRVEASIDSTGTPPPPPPLARRCSTVEIPWCLRGRDARPNFSRYSNDFISVTSSVTDQPADLRYILFARGTTPLWPASRYRNAYRYLYLLQSHSSSFPKKSSLSFILYLCTV